MKGRRLLNLWRISRFGETGEIFVAMFRPKGKDYLGAIIVEYNNRIMFSNYAAVFDMDGNSVWRVKDDALFSEKRFVVNSIVRNEEDQLQITFTWKGVYANSQFTLIDQSGLLVRKFINYTFD